MAMSYKLDIPLDTLITLSKLLLAISYWETEPFISSC